MGTQRRVSLHVGSLLIAIALLLGPLSLQNVARAQDDRPVVARSILVAVNDYVTNVYLNGVKLPDRDLKLEVDIFGATVMRVKVDVRNGDSLVFAVSNNRLRWGGTCGFSAAGLGVDDTVQFVTDPKSVDWTFCDSPDEAAKFIRDPAHLANNAVAAPDKAWSGCTTEMRKRVTWTGKPIWGNTKERVIWLRYKCSITAPVPGKAEDPTVLFPVGQTGTQPVAEVPGNPGAANQKPGRRQSSIKALYILKTESAGMLGSAADFILTVLPSNAAAKDTLSVSFGTPIGPQMKLVLEDVLRYVSVTYQNVPPLKLIFTFEDKYSTHDGGSIGAAMGTLIRSIIEGFEIDPTVAMTGDVSADGKVRMIGGLGAKLRGAKAAGSQIVAVPADNVEQLVDTLIYSGANTVAEVQVIGIATVDEAIAVARKDRKDELSQAIALFAEIQPDIEKTVASLGRKDIREKLQKVVDLAPQHLSATVLLQTSMGKQRKTLTLGASQYYNFAALNSVVPTLDEKKILGARKTMPEGIKQALASLDELKPIADPKIQPLVDATRKLISARNDYDLGRGSAEALKKRLRAYLDEVAKLSSDTESLEKMLREGI